MSDRPSDVTPGEDGGPERYQTFVGSGFGTVQIDRTVGTDAAPAAVSGRRYLRDGLPGVYREGDFGMRLVRAFEELLDPLVAVLDNLPEHFDPAYAPRDVLDLLTGWLGLEHDEARSGEERRRIVRMAPELMRRRGTKAGVELALELAFPGVPFRVQDGGSVTWSLELGEPEAAQPAAFVVYCDTPLSEARLGAVARLIDQAKPAHVSYRLRVKASKREDGSAT
jgi:phage tail-like protein